MRRLALAAFLLLAITPGAGADTLTQRVARLERTNRLLHREVHSLLVSRGWIVSRIVGDEDCLDSATYSQTFSLPADPDGAAFYGPAGYPVDGGFWIAMVNPRCESHETTTGARKINYGAW